MPHFLSVSAWGVNQKVGGSNSIRRVTFLHFEPGALLVDGRPARIRQKWPILDAFRSLSQSPGERLRSDMDAFRRIHAPLSQCLRKGVRVWLTDAFTVAVQPAAAKSKLVANLKKARA
jgi:hypothetical protein